MYKRQAADAALEGASLDARAWRREYAAQWARFLRIAVTHPLAALRAVWAFVVGVVLTAVLGVRPMKSASQDDAGGNHEE